MITTTLLSILLFGLLPFCASTPTQVSRSDPIHVPIVRRAGGIRDLAKAANHLRAKYNYQSVTSKRKRAGNTAAEPMINLVCYICAESRLLKSLLWTRMETQLTSE